MAIKSYFQNIADAIRVKGGTSALLTPAEMPQAIADLPTGGGGSGVDLTAVSEVGFIITAKRSTSDSYIQADRLDLMQGSSVYAFDMQNATCGVYGGTAIQSSSESPQQFWNGHAVGQGKTIISQLSRQRFYLFYIKLSNPVDLSQIDGWRWWTGNDFPDRDPVSFGLFFANGDEKNGVLQVMDFATNYSVTTNRNATAYEGSLLK